MAAAAAAPGPRWAHLTVAEAREAYARLELTVSLDPAIPVVPVRLSDDELLFALPASAVPWLSMTSIPLGHQDTNRVVSGAPSALVAFVRCARAGADFLSEVSANCASWVEGDERWPAASALLVTPARESWPAPADGQHVPATLTSATPPPGAITLTPAELDNYLGVPSSLAPGPAQPSWPTRHRSQSVTILSQRGLAHRPQESASPLGRTWQGAHRCRGFRQPSSAPLRQ